MIRVDHDGDVAIITLARAEKRNALTPEMLDQFQAAIQQTGGQARALLLAGDGPVFCGGFDLKLCLQRQEALAALLQGLHDSIAALKSLSIPVVIAAHGAAIAGGCALLGGADIVVVNEQARLGYPVTPLGISPAVSAPFLRLLTGDGRGRERLLDPDLITGSEALRIGLVHECVQSVEQVRPRALEIARGLAAKPPGAIAVTRDWLREIESRLSLPDAARALRASMALVGSEEERERLAKLFARD